MSEGDGDVTPTTGVEAATRGGDAGREPSSARDVLLGAVSHELLTPLTAVVGFSALLTDRYGQALPEEALDLAHRIHTSARQLQGLVGALLDPDGRGPGILEDKYEQREGVNDGEPSIQTPLVDRRRPRVVMVEDNADMRELVRLVTGPGWDVTAAPSAALGLAAIESGDPDVVLLDLGLPDASGTDVLQALQANERTSWIPVVVLSGDHAPASVISALLSGAQDFITKPFVAGELQARLTAALRVATAHRAVVEAEQLLLHQSLHDPLTGLANRVLLFDRLRQAQAQQARHNRGLAVLFLDLDQLKQVNDEHGHDVGDALLIQIANRMEEAVRDGDTVARLGGDEFVIVAESIDGPDAVAELAERVRAAMGRPHTVHGEEVVCTASIGVILPRPGQQPEEILREADRAMYRAKAEGKDRWVLVDEAPPEFDGTRRVPSGRTW